MFQNVNKSQFFTNGLNKMNLISMPRENNVSNENRLVLSAMHDSSTIFIISCGNCVWKLNVQLHCLGNVLRSWTFQSIFLNAFYIVVTHWDWGRWTFQSITQQILVIFSMGRCRSSFFPSTFAIFCIFEPTGYNFIDFFFSGISTHCIFTNGSCKVNNPKLVNSWICLWHPL